MLPALPRVLGDYTGRSLEEIEQDTERDFFMSAQEAVAYGLIDRVIDRPTLPTHRELIATR